MRSIIKVVLPVLILCALTIRSRALDIYVSERGSDTWTGMNVSRVGIGNNGPCASIDRALAEVRAFRKVNPQYHHPVAIIVESGTYTLAHPIIITPDVCGNSSSPLIIKAEAGARPVLSGGVVVTRWRKRSNGWWCSKTPTGSTFQELWANGVRRQRPRLPEKGWFTVQRALSPTKANTKLGYDRFEYKVGQVPHSFANQQDVDVLCVHIWAMARNKIAHIDPSSHTITFTGPTCSLAQWADYNPGNRYLFSNVKEALHIPGQWYLDRPTNTLTYIPVHGEEPGNTQVVVPRLASLMKLIGNGEENSYVRNVALQGLTFSYTSYQTPLQGHDFPQADADLGAAIEMTAARHVVLQDCRVTHTGTWAIQMGEGCRHDTIQNCVAYDLGSGGVKVGETVERVGKLNAGHDTIRNCIIAACGRIHPAATGVWIGRSSHNVVDHNTISDLYYTGISVGWTWGYAPTQANHNLISNNVIEQVGQGVLSDMGGIYLLGVAPGTVLKHNLLRNIWSATYGGWGIYFDEGTSNVLAKNNVVYNTKSGGLHQHYGADNLVINNIFAFAHTMQIRRTLAENHLSFKFEHNIVYFNQGVLLGGNWTGNDFKMDYNLYWNSSRMPITFSGLTLAQWQARGQDQHSLIAQPDFVNANAYDFRLRTGSPAVALGFKAIPISGWGSSLPVKYLTRALNEPETFPTDLAK